MSASESLIDARLRSLGNPKRAVQEKRYLKSVLLHLGVSVPTIRRVAREALRVAPGLTREDLLVLVERLWGRGVHEHRMCAVELLKARSELLDPSDFPFLQQLIRTSETWALVDNLSASVAAPLLERHPWLGDALDRWAADGDFWVRRAALLALLPPLRKGEGDFARFSRYADEMLEEKEFFIRKAIGWVLRDVGKSRPELVRDWLLPRARRASGLTVREAVRHLPEVDRRRIQTERARPAL